MQLEVERKLYKMIHAEFTLSCEVLKLWLGPNSCVPPIDSLALGARDETSTVDHEGVCVGPR